MDDTPKNTSTEASAELWALASRSCNDALRPEDLVRLESLLAEDPQARHFYGFYMLMHAELAWRFRTDERTAIEERGMAGSPAIDLPAGAAVELSSGQWSRTPNPESPIPPIVLDLSSTSHYPLPATPFVGSWAFSCMVATVIMGVMLLGFWAIKITHHQHIAEAPSQSAPSEARPEMVFVGRITGMVDVKWSDDPRYLPPLSSRAYVPLGRKYILNSGLLEITYDSGAKVILQGPCTYEVESTAGGYLALGKLTAKVESAKPQAANQKSEIRNLPHPSSFILHPSSLFSVRTPTAIVTDLGTEFGVEVDKSGVTESHVFRGKVKVLVLDGTGNLPSPSERGAGGEGSGREVILGENESARVQHGKDAEDRLVIVRGVADAAGFVRPGDLPRLAEERRMGPLRRWQAFSEELRKRDDLLAYYDFQSDESDRSVLRNRASTGRQFDGRFEGATWELGRVPGKYALRFGWRGSGARVNIPVECRQLTLAAWVKLDYLPLSRAGQYLSSLLMSDGCWGGQPGQVAWQITQEGAMVLSVYGSVRAIGPSPPGFSGGLRQDQWHFVAATCDLEAGKTGIYLDGALVGEQVLAVPDSAAIKLGGAMIGDLDDPSMSPDGRRQLRGRMEELMVFRAALSPTDIRRLFELQQPEHTREQR